MVHDPDVKLTLTARVCRLFTGLSLLAMATAQAAETVIPITPPGATDLDQAVLPPTPGVYGGVVVLPFDQNSKTYDSSGNAVPKSRSLNVNVQLIVPALVYVYPFRPFGGTLASTFIQPIERLHYSIGSSYSATQIGLGDAYSDLFQWTKNAGLFGATPSGAPIAYGLNVGVGLALIIPDGHYNRNVPLTDSGNLWVIDPNLALTYNTGPKLSLGDNTQLSARVFYGMPLKNHATKYQSGNVLDVDWSATQEFGLLRVGVAGYYQTQMTADRPADGTSLSNGNRFTEAGAGPVVEYLLPQYSSFVKVKYQYTFYHRNFLDQQFLVLTVGTKF